MKSENELKEFKNRQLQLYEGNRPLTQMEAARVTAKLKMEHVKLMSSNKDYEYLKKAGVTGRCCVHDGMHAGPGVCIASKYLKYGSMSSNGCSSCKAQEIVNQLNYIFKHAFKDRYKAEWRNKRSYKRNK